MKTTNRDAEVEVLAWQNLQPGLTRTFEVPLTEALLDQFAACSGDINPLHMDAEEARRRGFEGRVAHGMLLGALLSRLVGCHLPGRNALLLASQFKFNRPCVAGETVRVEGRIDSLSEATQTVSLSVRFLVKGEPRAGATALAKVQK
ncbi:MAG: MaoC family dehydratase [Verrucomicrobiae bacterium]|nr:MaoC family dehydratase [Verrucomicrobiae bacterium]